MARPVVVPALKAFSSELTSVAPRRTLPDWFLGDKAHALSSSGHNPDDTPGSKAEYSDADNIPEIRAGDYRLPLNAPFTAEQVVQLLVKLCRQGKITWISYIIYNGRIWSAKSGWVTRKYTGRNKHDKHFHISCKPDNKSENSTGKVGLHVLLPTKARVIPMVERTVKFPELKKGDADPVWSGAPNHIKRIQAVLNYLTPGEDLKLDGDYGAKTAAKVKAMMKDDASRSSSDGTRFYWPEWRRLYGLW